MRRASAFDGSAEPEVPVFRPGILFKGVRSGGCYRAWYERLLRTLRARGWAPSNIDSGLFYKRSPVGVLEGVMLMHVDVTGNEEAQELPRDRGRAGFRVHGEVNVNMVEYHRNLQIPVVSRF